MGLENAYILGLGRVHAEGARVIAPQDTTEYTLLADSPNGVVSKTVAVSVSGSRGIEYAQGDGEEFAYRLSQRKAVSSLSTFINKVHDVLQNELQFTVRASGGGGQVLALTTNLSDRPSLVGPEEKRIAARRLAYRVEMQNTGTQPGEITCDVKTLIQYRRRVEQTWRKDTDEALHRAQAAALLRRISQLSGN